MRSLDHVAFGFTSRFEVGLRRLERLGDARDFQLMRGGECFGSFRPLARFVAFLFRDIEGLGGLPTSGSRSPSTRMRHIDAYGLMVTPLKSK
jgi:hypothetical protein